MGLKQYVVKRVLLLVPVLFGVSLIAFGLIQILPGDPVTNIVGPETSMETIRALRREHGLNRPIYIQYIDWLTGALVLNFGETISTGRKVTPLVTTAIAPTYWLAGLAMFISVLIGIPAGIISAANQYSAKDNAVTVFAFLGLSVPNFWLAIMLILLLGLYIPIMPTLGYVDPLKDPISGFRFLLLPAVALGTANAAVVTRMMRSSMIEALSEEYIRSARSKGLPRRMILNKHAVKNALLPTITIIGLNFGYLLGGAVIVEQIFAIPGMGRLILQSVFSREFKVIQAALLLIALTFAIVNLLTDLLYAYLDPRIKYD